MTCPICNNDWKDSNRWCEHYLLSYDITFPYAGANNCPLEIDGQGFDASLLEEMNNELDRILLDQLTTTENKASLAQLPTRIEKLITMCVLETEIDEGEVMRDEYADHSAFSEYLIDLLQRCPTYYGQTRFEDSVPMASSAYSAHWATDAKKCSNSLSKILTGDLEMLRSFGKTG